MALITFTMRANIEIWKVVSGFKSIRLQTRQANLHYQKLHSWHRLSQNSISASDSPDDGEVAVSVANEACIVDKRLEESEIRPLMSI